MNSHIPHPPRPKAILFDHDGVLVRSEPLHWVAWRATVEELGLPYVHEEISSQIGSSAPLILSQLLDKYRPNWSPEQYDVHAIALNKNKHYRTALAKNGIELYEGVLEGLQWLKAHGIKAAVVSNSLRNELILAHQYAKTTPLFDLLQGRDDCKAVKPSPDPYLIAAASLEVSPEDCIVVEDSPFGIEAGLLAKIPCAAILANFSKEVMQMPVPGRPDLKPTWILPTMIDFFDILRK